jgi:hypothetical protein
MKPRPVHHKRDLVNLIRDHTPTRACSRALDEGTVIALGGFAPAQGCPRWILQVDSARGRRWYIAVVVDEQRHRYSIEYPETIEWADWNGRSDRRHPVYDGDDPVIYAFRRMKARQCSEQDSER